MVGRHPRPPDRHPRLPTDRSPAAGWSPIAGRSRSRRRSMAGHPAAARLRRQGGRLRRRSRTGRSVRRHWSLAARRRRLGAHGRLQRSLRRRGRSSRPPARHASAATPSTRRARRALGVPRAGRPCSPRPASCSASRPASSTARRRRRPRARSRRPTRLHLALWHGVDARARALGRRRSPAARCSRRHATRSSCAARPRRARSRRRRRSTWRRCAASNRVADRVTGVVQNGSLPIYARRDPRSPPRWCPGSLLRRRRRRWPGWLDLVRRSRPAPDRRRSLVGAALGAAIVRRRFAGRAVPRGRRLRDGGAVRRPGRARPRAHPGRRRDALDRVVFVLVLRRLPDRFERPSTPRRRGRAHRRSPSPSASMVFVFALVAGGHRTATAGVRRDGRRGRCPTAHGRNVVNVILVDFRGFDTLGEITVLAAAAIGAVALARAGRRRPASPTATATADAAAAEPVRDPPHRVRRRLGAQVVFHAVLVGSLWLLFAGHNQPGGGFVGGLVAGAAIALRYLAGGHRRGARPVAGSGRGRPRRRPAARRGHRRRCRCSSATRCSRSVGVDARPRRCSATSSSTLGAVFDIGVYLASSAWCSWCSRRSATTPRDEAAAVTVDCSPPTAAALFGIGTYLVLQRKLSRIIIGLGLLSHGANVLLITAGPPRRCRRSSARGDAADVRRPAAAGAGAHRDRDHASASPPSCSRSPTAAGCSPRDDEVEDDVERPRASRAGVASPTRRSTTRRPRSPRRRRRGRPVSDAGSCRCRSCCRCSAPALSILVGRSRRGAAGHRPRRCSPR